MDTIKVLHMDTPVSELNAAWTAVQSREDDVDGAAVILGCLMGWVPRTSNEQERKQKSLA